MARRRSFIPFVMAAVAGAAGGAAFIQFARQRQTIAAKLRAGSQIIDTKLGPVEYAEAGSGPSVLAIHGVIGGYDQALAVTSPLAESGYRVIAISRPGYLRTPLIEDMSPAGQADLYAAFLDAVGVKEAIVMGISAGGPSAVTFAARYPERCKALIMLCAVSKAMEIKEEELSASNQMLAAARDSDFLMWLAIHLTIRTLPLVALRQPELRSRLISNPARMRMYSRVLWGLFPATLRRTGTIYDEEIIKVLPPLPFKKVSAPTLVLHGTTDTLVPPDNARNTASKIPGAELILVRGGEHSFFVPYYDEVWPEVRQFLAQAIKPPKAAAAKAAADSKPKAAAKPAPKRPAPTKRTTAKATPATKAPPRPRPARRTPSGQ